MKNITQVLITALICLYIILEYGEKFICLTASNKGCSIADGWGDSIVMILTPVILTIKDKKSNYYFISLIIITAIFFINIPLGNQIRIPTITITSVVFLIFLFIMMIKNLLLRHKLSKNNRME